MGVAICILLVGIHVARGESIHGLGLSLWLLAIGTGMPADGA